MLNDNVITIDFNKINKAISECEEPVVMICSFETVSAIASAVNEIEEIDVLEEEFDRLVTYSGVPITVNPHLPFGHMIIK